MSDKEAKIDEILTGSGKDGNYSDAEIVRMAAIASGNAKLGDTFQVGPYSNRFNFIGIKSEAALYRTITSFMADAETRDGESLTLPQLIVMYPDILMQCAVPILISHYRQAELRKEALPPFGGTEESVVTYLENEPTVTLDQLMSLVFGTLSLQGTSVLLGKVFALVGTLLSVSMGAGAMKASVPPQEPSA